MFYCRKKLRKRVLYVCTCRYSYKKFKTFWNTCYYFKTSIVPQINALVPYELPLIPTEETEELNCYCVKKNSCINFYFYGRVICIFKKVLNLWFRPCYILFAKVCCTPKRIKNHLFWRERCYFCNWMFVWSLLRTNYKIQNSNQSNQVKFDVQLKQIRVSGLKYVSYIFS